MPEEIFLMIVLIIGWLTAIAIEFQCTRWHKKHDVRYNQLYEGGKINE